MKLPSLSQPVMRLITHTTPSRNSTTATVAPSGKYCQTDGQPCSWYNPCCEYPDQLTCLNGKCATWGQKFRQWDHFIGGGMAIY